MLKACEFCSKEFETNNSIKIYCSSTCRRKRKYIENEKGKVRNYTYNCKNCGKDYNPKNKDRDSFCSRDCYFKYLKIKAVVNESNRNIVKQEKKKVNAEVKIKKQNQLKLKRLLKRLLKTKVKLKEITCKECGDLFNTDKPNNIYCSIQCKNKRNNRQKYIREIRKRTNGFIDNDITLMKLYERDNGICQICGEKCDNYDFKTINDVFITGNNYPSIDHVYPISKGGSHTWDNIQLAHRICNSIKSDNVNHDDVDVPSVKR
jgi:5-methylcytosine-specific restriction endonuclease McrA